MNDCILSITNHLRPPFVSAKLFASIRLYQRSDADEPTLYSTGTELRRPEQLQVRFKISRTFLRPTVSRPCATVPACPAPAACTPAVSQESEQTWRKYWQRRTSSLCTGPPRKCLARQRGNGA